QANIAVSGTGPWTITVSSLSPAATQHVVITYGDTSGGGSGVTATSTTGATTWTVAENSIAGAGLVNIGVSPATTVYAVDGSGTATATTKVSASATGQTITTDYTVATGGMSGGAVSMVVPSGWTAPQKTTANAAGYVTATSNGVAVAAGNIAITGSGPWTITVS